MPLSIFPKRSILDVRQSSEYASPSRPWQTQIIFIIFLRLFDVQNFPFTTGETMGDYYL